MNPRAYAEGNSRDFYNKFFCTWSILVVLDYVVNDVVEQGLLQVVQQVLSVHPVNLGREFSLMGWEGLYPSFSLLLTPLLLGFSDGISVLIRCRGTCVD
jgi:hypothetical protein